MSHMPLLTVIVPAYNEEKRIGRTLRDIVRYLQTREISYELLIVDDGSTDRTAEVVDGLRLPGLEVISYGENRGKGAAVKYGVEKSHGLWILFTDADNSTPINQLAKLWPYCQDYEVIVGSRYLPDSDVQIKQAPLRIFGSRLGNLLIRLLILPGLRDTQCGFKLFSQKAAKEIFPYQSIAGWGFDMEILRIAREHKYKIKEVPVRWLNSELSRIRSGRVFLRTFVELLTIKQKSLAGRYR